MLKRHILWLEPGHEVADPISGSRMRGDFSPAVPPPRINRTERFYFFTQLPGAWVNWELTYRCPQRCRHCFQPKMAADPEETPARREQVLRWLQEGAPEELSLTGGDPALVPDLPVLLQAVRETLPQTRLRLLTTGPGLCQRRDYEELLALCRTLGVTVHLTLLGATAAQHDTVAGSAGSFAALEKVTQDAHAMGVEVELRVHLFRGALREWFALCAQAEALAPGRWHLSSLLYPPRNGQGSSAWRELLPRLATWRVWVASESGAALATEFLSAEPVCAAGCQVVTISPSGTVRGCDLSDAFYRPSAAEGAAVLRQAAWRWRQQQQQRPRERCAACPWRDWCRYCPVGVAAWGTYFCERVALAGRHMRRRLQALLQQGATPVAADILESLERLATM